jgi:hypothetical protein
VKLGNVPQTPVNRHFKAFYGLSMSVECAGFEIYIGTNLRSTTGEQGRYELQYLLPGNYRITLRAPYSTNYAEKL